MKIKRLWVSKYKNLEDSTFLFSSDLTTLLVGKNGLGKSNLIEILALIFKDLDLITKKEDFENWSYNKNKFEYEINYECNGNDIDVKIKKGHFEVKSKIVNSKDDYSSLTFSEFIRDRKIKYLPKYIIGYYSGENKRIGKIIEEHETIEKNRLKNFHRKKDGEGESTNLRKLFFTENYHSQILLLTLALYKNDSEFSSEIEELFNDYLGIEDIIDFEIKFNNPNWDYSKVDGRDKGMDFLIANIGDGVANPFWNTKGKVDKLLTRLYNHQIDNSTEPIYYENDGDEDKRKFVNEFLVFNNIKFNTFINELKELFEHPINFFDALEATTIIDIFNSISLKVVKKNVPDPIEFEQLSEGEQQLLTVLGLVLVTGKDDCLFLLDEPDTHLNPDWQRDYPKLIEKFNLNDHNSHVIIATHSPLIVQSSEESDVFLFKESEGKVVIDSEKHQIHNWRIDQVLQSEYFGFKNTRPSNLDSFMKKREEMLSKNEVTKEDIKYLQELDQQIGSLPSGETLNDFQTMRLLNRILKENKND
ncbi:MAG: AAA family ATPase [Arenibacter algicola]